MKIVFKSSVLVSDAVDGTLCQSENKGLVSYISMFNAFCYIITYLTPRNSINSK